MQTTLFDTPLPGMYCFEQQLRQDGYRCIAGIDEAGRGPLAGPVVAAAVIIAPDRPLEGVNDSKQLSEQQRERLFDLITGQAEGIGIGIVDAGEIDRINILQATRLAMRCAVDQLATAPDCLLIDGITRIDSPLRQLTIKQGDSRSASIAAASIIAKVTRDRMMQEYDQQYPGYGFARHKGYGSTAHYAALRQLGPCPIHRMTFRGVLPTTR